MLETTTRLLRIQGYNGTGLNQIVKESKTPKGSLYYHFPGGKEQLASEAIDAAAQMMTGRIHEAFHHTKSAQEAVERILEVSAAELEETDFQCGCPIATVALEVSTTDGVVRQACQRAFMGVQKVLEKNLYQSGLDEQKAGDLAEFMITVYEGALLLSRARREVSPLRNLRRSIPLLLS